MLTTLALTLALTQAQAPAPPALDTMAGGLRQLYSAIRTNIVAAADVMPESDYGYRPTTDVRTFAQLIGHVTNTHYNFCAAARGVASPARLNHETLTTKAELVKAIRESVAFCDPAYDGLTEPDVAAAAKFGNMAITKGYALVFNIAHDNEHYGNMVTYLRHRSAFIRALRAARVVTRPAAATS